MTARGDYYDSLFGAAYSAYMERPRLSRWIGRIVWGGDARPYYKGMAAIDELPEGGTVVDCPCGAGPVLRAIPADSSIHYIGADLSPAMLRRARKRAAVRALTGPDGPVAARSSPSPSIDFIEADAADLPLPSASADLFFSLWGLHCFPDPAAALVEASRVLKPGGHLVGASFVRGIDSLRQRLLIRPNTGDFGPLGSQSEIESWLAAAGLDHTRTNRSGPFLFFDAVR